MIFVCNYFLCPLSVSFLPLPYNPPSFPTFPTAALFPRIIWRISPNIAHMKNAPPSVLLIWRVSNPEQLGVGGGGDSSFWSFLPKIFIQVINFVLTIGPSPREKWSCVHTVEPCPMGSLATACTGDNKRKIPMLPSPWVEADQSLYFVVNTGKIITWH